MKKLIPLILTAALTPKPTPGAGLGSDLGPGGGPLPRHVLAQMLCQSLISPTLQIVLGLAAMRLNERGIKRPVRVIWSILRYDRRPCSGRGCRRCARPDRPP